MNLVISQTKQRKNFKENLKKFIRTIKETQSNSLILSCELSLSGYSYDSLEESANFGKVALKKLLEVSKNKAIALTMTTKKDDKFFNTFYFIANKKILHTQNKVKLFTLSDEQKHFTSGNEKDIKIFEYRGIKIAVLICFELRFIELWERLKGADVILVPAMWGVKRKKHYETLCRALAIANQCYVMASNSKNKEFSKGSAIVTPFGKVYKDNSKRVIQKDFDLQEIKRMRRYLDVGIKR